MLFNSYIFVLLLLPATLLMYYLLNHYKCYKTSMSVLIFASIFFYAYNNVKYVFILITSILLNWGIAWLIHKYKYKKLLLLVGILVNVGCIFYFKYYNFFITNINQVVGADFNYVNVVLPLGISFYTFQQISYLVDTYNGETKEYTFLEYAAFVSFFPQLVAGPIVLHGEIISQFKDEERKNFDHESFSTGFYVFAIGMIKKVIIADTLGIAVSYAWEKIDYLSAIEIIIVMLSYTFQIYFDFSGYCDMAIGIGKMFRIDLPINFNSPYKALSIVDFWKRWHMTLTRFLRQYVYFSLGGSKKGKTRTYLNVLIVFIVSGIWHGANWTFILWGILHGIANILNRMFEKVWDKLHGIVKWVLTFGFINFTWLLFRADTVKQAAQLLKRILCFETMKISSELSACYVLKEIRWFQEVTGNIVSEEFLSYSCMWSLLIVCLWICVRTKNLHEKNFVPTLTKAIITPILLIWAVVSFSEVSTFLYFNF